MQAYPFVKFFKDEIDWNALTGAEIRILMWLVERMNFEGVVVTQHWYLAKQNNLTRRYEIKCLKKLRDIGIISTQPQPGSHVAIWVRKGFSHRPESERNNEPAGWQLTFFHRGERENNHPEMAGV